MNTRAPSLDRRAFLCGFGLGGIALLLPGCGEPEPDPALRYPPPAQWMDHGPLRSRFADVHGVRVHALVADEADARPPLVLVHGSGLSGRYMVPVARRLADTHPVYVPDIPGFGDSGDPGRILRVPEMADWLDAWLDVVRLPPAALLGNSFGCQVIADLAARYPARVSHAILQGPTTPPDERSAFWQFVRWRQNQAHNPGWLGSVTDRDYDRAGALRLVRGFIDQVTDRIEDKLPQVRAPVLVVRGERDPIAGQDYCAWLASLAPRGELAVIPDVAHTLVFTAPEPLAAVTREFVDRHRSEPAA